MAQLLEDCGIPTAIADQELCVSLQSASAANDEHLAEWVRFHGITALGFSYRLDPADGLAFFRQFVRSLHRTALLDADGGPVRALYFAGLPSTCELVQREFPEVAAVFCGDELPIQTLALLGLSPSSLPASLMSGMAYEDARWQFAADLIRRAGYRSQPAPARDYPGFGTAEDRLVDRIQAAQREGTLPLMRAHVGAYLADREQAVTLNRQWAQELAASGHLDVLSVGSSQLTQSEFFGDWTGKPNGGGVPLQTETEFAELWQAARPLLVRAYSGTRDVVRVAQMLESTIHIAWHALSLWWFCQIDGRGPNTVRDNLHEHWNALRFIASTNKPFEPNLPHHFAFRGGDDVSYVVSGYLAARLAKRAGIQHFVLQVMLNTPKATWGVQDLAKARTLLKLVRSLEGPDFRVYLQPRGGLDYFSPNDEKAKIQLAAVTALMDDIEPENPNSPALIHVVSYTEASRLADPPAVDESIQITRQALQEWRQQRRDGRVPNMAESDEVASRERALGLDCQKMIHSMETHIPDLYSPEGLYQVLAAGYFPLPYLWECRAEFHRAAEAETRLYQGGVVVVDEDRRPLTIERRLERIERALREGQHG